MGSFISLMLFLIFVAFWAKILSIILKATKKNDGGGSTVIRTGNVEDTVMDMLRRSGIETGRASSKQVYRKKVVNGRTVLEEVENIEQEFGNMQIVGDIMQRVGYKPEGRDYELLEKAKVDARKYVEAISNADVNGLKDICAEWAINDVQKSIDKNNEDGCVEHFDNFDVKSCDVSAQFNNEEYTTKEIEIYAKTHNYLEDNNSGRVVAGDKNIWVSVVIKIVYRKRKNEHIKVENGICEQCGAPLDNNMSACNYCGALIGSGGYTIYKIEHEYV